LNKLNHIFNNLEHGLQGFVESFGSQNAAYDALKRAAQRGIEAQGLLGGTFKVVGDVGGVNVTITGTVTNGVARVGTAYVQ
jgi:hypothetical protein